MERNFWIEMTADGKRQKADVKSKKLTSASAKKGTFHYSLFTIHYRYRSFTSAFCPLPSHGF